MAGASVLSGMRPLLATASVLVFGLIAVAASAASGHGPAAPPAAVVSRPLATADPTNTLRADVARESGRDLPIDLAQRRFLPAVSGLLLPIADVALPTDAESLPNAPREYRAGWHEGIDFPAERGAPVRAAAAGTIVRIDHDFVDWDPAILAAATDEARALGYTPEPTLDRIRGRQVWIDHGAGIVTRYAHLESVVGLSVGAHVERGEVIGTVGSSGFEEGGPHLHFEIRLDDGYLGDGLSGDALMRVLSRAFDLPSPRLAR